MKTRLTRTDLAPCAPDLAQSGRARRAAPYLQVQGWSRRADTGGYLLGECLIYIGLFALVVGLAFGAFYRCLDQSRALRRNADDIVRALKAGERWREDVRRAIAQLEFTGRDDGPILVIPQAGDVVTYAFYENKVWRGSTQRQVVEPVLSDVRASRMQVDTREHVRSWRWELELATKKKSPRVRPLFTFQTVSQRLQLP